jgi:hypothetical protein
MRSSLPSSYERLTPEAEEKEQELQAVRALESEEEVEGKGERQVKEEEEEELGKEAKVRVGTVPTVGLAVDTMTAAATARVKARTVVVDIILPLSPAPPTRRQNRVSQLLTRSPVLI